MAVQRRDFLKFLGFASLSILLRGSDDSRVGSELQLNLSSKTCSDGTQINDGTFIGSLVDQDTPRSWMTSLDQGHYRETVSPDGDGKTKIVVDVSPKYTIEVDRNGTPISGDGILQTGEWELLNPNPGFHREVIILGDPRSSNRKVLEDSFTPVPPQEGLEVCMNKSPDDSFTFFTKGPEKE